MVDAPTITKRSVQASAGAADVGALVALNSSGAVDSTMLPSLFGTAWPTSPADGQLYFKTDESEPELFFYHSSTGDWLSVRVMEFDFVETTAAGAAQWLYVPGAGITTNATPDFGYRMNHDALIQEISYATNATPGTNLNYVVRQNGAISSVGITQTTVDTDGHQSGFEVEFSAGDIMGLRATNSVPAPAVVRVLARRRITP